LDNDAITTILSEKLRPGPTGMPAFSFRPDLPSRAQKLVEAMLQYVMQHYHRPFSLGDLASAMNMNASYLSALFSQATGMTFHHFLQEIRLSKAKELLGDSRNRICETACATGYASPDVFRRAFKAREGVSPEDWRACH
jgi:two-component system response regulator YesN